MVVSAVLRCELASNFCEVAFYAGAMKRPLRFEHHRYVGDKRTQVVYDMDADDVDEDIINELMESEKYLCFGPDTLVEARNRNYRLWKGHSVAS